MIDKQCTRTQLIPITTVHTLHRSNHNNPSLQSLNVTQDSSKPPPKKRQWNRRKDKACHDCNTVYDEMPATARGPQRKKKTNGSAAGAEGHCTM